MAEAGVSDKTILAYIDTAQSVTLTGDDVVALHKRGVSDNVITAMLQRAPQPLEPLTPTTSISTQLPISDVTPTTVTGLNAPIVYPTPVREATPLLRPYTVRAAPYLTYSGPSSVMIVGSPYCAGGSYYSGSFRGYSGYGYGGYGYGYPSCGAYGGGYRSYGWGGGYAGRCRF